MLREMVFDGCAEDVEGMTGLEVEFAGEFVKDGVGSVCVIV